MDDAAKLNNYEERIYTLEDIYALPDGIRAEFVRNDRKENLPSYLMKQIWNIKKYISMIKGGTI